MLTLDKFAGGVDNSSRNGGFIIMTADKNKNGKTTYAKPVLIVEKNMVFTKEVWDEFNNGNWCFGCSNCNCN